MKIKNIKHIDDKILHKGKAVAIGIFSLCASSAIASAPYMSESLQNSEAPGYLVRARNMMADRNYVGAIDQLNQMRETASEHFTQETMQECYYLLAKAYYERGEKECIDLLKQYVAEYPASLHTLEARLLIGDYYFYASDFAQALGAYNDVDFNSLNTAQRTVYTYRKGLSMTKVGLFDEARPMFEDLVGDKEHGNAARFYIAYLDYVAQDYDKALEGFRAVDETTVAGADRKGMKRSWEYSPTGLEAGYYITHIEYHKGRYQDVVDHGRDLLQKSPVPELVPEMNRIIGESYYKLGEESVAGQFLEAYLASDQSTPVNSAVYIMGVIDYNQGNYQRATELFGSLTDLDNEIGQSSYLYLGQCAMRSKDYSSAAIAFEKAYSPGYDTKVSETALYNYAVACTSGGKVPFGSSIDLLETFIKTYPKSQYASTVDEFLATAYYNERDYHKALASIERIANPKEKVLAAKQKVLYELGIEALSNGRNDDAIDYMTKAANMGKYDQKLATQSYLWLGDAHYAKADYTKAAEAYESFMNNASPSDANYDLAMYNAAYAYYMKNNFAKARELFKKAVGRLPSDLQSDATLRIADCNYFTGKPKEALKGYAEAEQKDCRAKDYALFQHANMQGMIGNHKAKLSELDDLQKKYPQSVWIPVAMLEKAQTYEELGKTSDAIAAFKALTTKYPQSVEARQGMLQLAIVYLNSGKRSDAEEVYCDVIRRWPSSEQAQAANEDLRRIYASRGELQQYRQFLSSIPNSPQLDDDDMEQLTFEAAENDVAQNSDDINKMQLYVEQYPNGKYLASALYYIASSKSANQDYESAIEALNKLISHRGDSNYAPQALYMKAQIMETTMMCEPIEIVKIYKELERRGGADYTVEAYLGVMRNTPKASEQLDYAQKLLSLNGLTTEQQEEARYYRAKASLEKKDKTQAESDLKELTKNVKSLFGAKAAVELGELYLADARLSDAESLLVGFTDEGTPHQYWLARGFIVLADVYAAQGKTSLAKEYVKSLRDNYPGSEPDIHDMINQRLKNYK